MSTISILQSVNTRIANINNTYCILMLTAHSERRHDIKHGHSTLFILAVEKTALFDELLLFISLENMFKTMRRHHYSFFRTVNVLADFHFLCEPTKKKQEKRNMVEVHVSPVCLISVYNTTYISSRLLSKTFSSFTARRNLNFDLSIIFECWMPFS